MRKLTLFLIVCALSLCLGAQSTSIYNFTMDSIDSKPVNLGGFSGKVVLIVNVASKCGFTPQYAALESLYEKYKDKGFVIIGVPANNFMSRSQAPTRKSRPSAPTSTTSPSP